MLKSWKLLLLLILLLPGVALIIYLFFRENIKNLGDNLTGNKVEIPVEGEPTQSTLLESLFNSPIDFGLVIINFSISGVTRKAS